LSHNTVKLRVCVTGTNMPVKLAPAFQFSQSSLQDYTDCARRFQLRYLMQQEWPAPIAEPLSDAEQADILGKRFHQLVERYWLGLPIKREELEPTLIQWWDAFLAHPVPELPRDNCKPEVRTSAVINGHRVTATFDLLAYNTDGDVVIVDWKTTQHRSSREWLDKRLQTIVYPVLLVESSERLLGYAVKPEQVRLIYWFANAPENVEVFVYSRSRYEQDKQMLANIMERLLATPDIVWPLTPNTKLCRLCQYRSLCERGDVAGSIEEFDMLETDDPEVMTNQMHSPVNTDDYIL
jgi:hypothetical protein